MQVIRAIAHSNAKFYTACTGKFEYRWPIYGIRRRIDSYYSQIACVGLVEISNIPTSAMVYSNGTAYR